MTALGNVSASVSVTLGALGLALASPCALLVALVFGGVAMEESRSRTKQPKRLSRTLTVQQA